MATHSSILVWRIPMDRWAWRVTVHSVTQSQTQLKQHSTHKQQLLWMQLWITYVPNQRLTRLKFSKTIGLCWHHASSKFVCLSQKQIIFFITGFSNEIYSSIHKNVPFWLSTEGKPKHLLLYKWIPRHLILGKQQKHYEINWCSIWSIWGHSYKESAYISGYSLN